MLNNLFTLGKFVHGPGQIRFSDLLIAEHFQLKNSIDGGKELKALDPYLLSRVPPGNQKCSRKLSKNSLHASQVFNWLVRWVLLPAPVSLSVPVACENLLRAIIAAFVGEKKALVALQSQAPTCCLHEKEIDKKCMCQSWLLLTRIKRTPQVVIKTYKNIDWKSGGNRFLSYALLDLAHVKMCRQVNLSRRFFTSI